MKLALWMRWECARLSRLTVAQAQAEVERLLARGDVFETAPRRLGLGEAEAWLGPANRAFCARFERLTVRGWASELVLGAQTLGARRRVAALRLWPEVTQEEGSDAVVAQRSTGTLDPLPSLWHLAVLAAATFRPRAVRPLRVAAWPPPFAAVRHGLGCAVLLALLAAAAWATAHPVGAALCWLLAVYSFVAGRKAARDDLLNQARYQREWQRVRELSVQQARALVASGLLEGLCGAEAAQCPLDTDQPLGPATREWLERWSRAGFSIGKGFIPFADRATLGPSALLPGHVCVGGESLLARAGDDALVEVQRRGGSVVVLSRWPSVWHYLVAIPGALHGGTASDTGTAAKG